MDSAGAFDRERKLKKRHRKLARGFRLQSVRRSSRRSLVRLERWQWIVLILLGIASAGGIFQLTQVRRQTDEWSSFLDKLGNSDFVVRIDRDDRRFSGIPYGQDESGRTLPLHEYMGVFPWSNVDDVVRQRRSAVDLWLIQLANFTYDFDKLKTRDPVWQSVRQTWKTKAGVCRDSATVLADVLAESGHDARMVLGDVSGPDWPDGGGLHAWVALIDPVSGNEYLLESTASSQESRMRTPPRVAVKKDYSAHLQVVKAGYYVDSGGGGRSMTKGWTLHRLK